MEQHCSQRSWHQDRCTTEWLHAGRSITENTQTVLGKEGPWGYQDLLPGGWEASLHAPLGIVSWVPFSREAWRLSSSNSRAECRFSYHVFSLPTVMGKSTWLAPKYMVGIHLVKPICVFSVPRIGWGHSDQSVMIVSSMSWRLMRWLGKCGCHASCSRVLLMTLMMIMILWW